MKTTSQHSARCAQWLLLQSCWRWVRRRAVSCHTRSPFRRAASRDVPNSWQTELILPRRQEGKRLRPLVIWSLVSGRLYDLCTSGSWSMDMPLSRNLTFTFTHRIVLIVFKLFFQFGVIWNFGLKAITLVTEVIRRPSEILLAFECW